MFLSRYIVHDSPALTPPDLQATVILLPLVPATYLEAAPLTPVSFLFGSHLVESGVPLVRVDMACLVRGLIVGNVALQLHEPLYVKWCLPSNDAFLSILKPAILTRLTSAAKDATDDG